MAHKIDLTAVMSKPPTTARRLFSIGHSNHALEKFLDLLRQHRIDVLVDARSHPYSRFTPHFRARLLNEAVTGAGITYLFMGKELGGLPDGDEFYDAEGHVLYWRVAESRSFLDGIARLENGITKYCVAIMCSEEDPSDCHRRLLVGRVLKTRGVQLEHIRGDGRIQTEAEFQAEEAHRSANGQIGFFEESPQENAWKSKQPVLQRGRRRSHLNDIPSSHRPF
jgi:uncharacterized protein (DUF488 family)